MTKSIISIAIFSIFLMLNACKESNENNVVNNESQNNITSETRSTQTGSKLEVYAFHGTNQCTTCKNMKANSLATLEQYFKNELANGTITFEIIDVDDKKNEQLAEKFQATGTALMVNKIINGKDSIVDFSDMAFEKANDKTAFVEDFKIKVQNLIN